VIAWYGFAKLAEAADHMIWTASGGLLAGHALKHALAAAAGVASLMPLWTPRRRRQRRSLNPGYGRRYDNVVDNMLPRSRAPP